MLTIRQATLADAHRLLEIYAPYVEETAISFEYVAPSVKEFQRRISTIMQRYPYLVAEENGMVIGYAYASAFKEREAFRMTVETSVYVDTCCKQKGIGRQLYSALGECLRANGIQSMCACIAYTNEADDPYLPDGSIAFHERLGFHKVAHFHRCGWKFSRWYDIVWMEKLLCED
jgi:phosphinothricin acetyltransferase